jgi:branched-chain amino acid transport system permease protein
MGVPTYQYKLVAFAISCALAGLAGSIHALFVNYVTVGETFGITVPLTVVLMSVLGGSRHWAGPALGALVITCLMYAFTAGNSAVLGRAAFGAVLVAVILFMPNGLMTWAQGLVRRKPSSGVSASTPSAATHEALTSKSENAIDSIAARGQSTGASGQKSVENRLQPLLEVKGLAKHFTGVKALDGVDVHVYPGEILGLLGPNGSGKSTFINVVSGHYAATAGTVRFNGQDLSGAPAHVIAATGIARTYQIPRPFAQMTVLQNVALVGMFGSAQLSRAQAEFEAWTWLEFTGLKDKAQALPEELNLHQRKFLELARALAARPKLVLLDEVLSGLTPSEIQGAVALIRKIRDQGATIVFVEHVMHAVMALVDRIVVLNHGQLLAEGAPQEVMRNPAVVKAYLGGAIEQVAQPGGADAGRADGVAHA